MLDFKFTLRFSNQLMAFDILYIVKNNDHIHRTELLIVIHTKLNIVSLLVVALTYLVKHDEADSDLWLQDTHGVKDGERGAEERDLIPISEEELPEFDIWFFEKRPVAVDTRIKSSFEYWDISPPLPLDIQPSVDRE